MLFLLGGEVHAMTVPTTPHHESKENRSLGPANKSAFCKKSSFPYDSTSNTCPICNGNPQGNRSQSSFTIRKELWKQVCLSGLLGWTDLRQLWGYLAFFSLSLPLSLFNSPGTSTFCKTFTAFSSIPVSSADVTQEEKTKQNTTTTKNSVHEVWIIQCQRVCS